MSLRPLQIIDFLDQQGWGEATPEPFAGDFSPRRYARLTHPDGRHAILMDADGDQKTGLFVAVADLLRDCGLSSPRLYAAHPDQGLVLMEDFGTRNIGALIDAGAEARPFFLRAADALALLHQNFRRESAVGLALPTFDAALFATQAAWFVDHYIPYAKQRAANDEERADFHAAWLAVLRPLDNMPQSLLLRDFMPDNVMDIPDGRLGVLDFQDAGIGPVAYDLASLCEEVRRDGGFDLLPEVITRYRAQSDSPLSHKDLLRACTILSAQRHTRIMGNVARMASHAGRPEKLAFLPRLHRHMQRVLQEPALMPVRLWMETIERSPA